MGNLKVCTFNALIPVEHKQQLIPTYGSGKRPQEELMALAKTNSDSYIRVVKPQFLDEEIVQGSPEFYQASRKHLDKLLEANALCKVEHAMFLYEQSQPGIQPLRGFVLAVNANCCINGSVKKHENVIESKANRLVTHIEALDSISEPVLLAQKLPPDILTILHQSKVDKPLVINVDVQGFEHKLWQLSLEEVQQLESAFSKLDSLYIADGHHRVESVSKYLMTSGKHELHGLMSLVMDQDDLLIKSFHRIISGIGEIDFEEYFIRKSIDYRKVDSVESQIVGPNEALVMCKNAAYLFQLGTVSSSMNAVAQLEVSRVESGIFKELFNIQNSSTDNRIAFMRGDTPLAEMQNQLNLGKCDCVFVLAANTFHQVEAVADQGLTMPPKSTWVEPKLLTGFVSQYFG